MDRITITGVTATGYHGVFAHERRDGQLFAVDVEMGVDLGPAAASDDLSDTVDYGAVAGAIVALIEGEPCDLVETLAEQVARACLAHELVQQVTVVVHKPEAPVGVPFDDVAITITRAK